MRISTIYDHASPLNLDDLFANYPTLTREVGGPTTTERYADISTAAVLRALASDGFGVHAVTVAGTRNAARQGFQKHSVRLRKTGYVGTRDGMPEVIMGNSHDGSSSWSFAAGYYRKVCSNGLHIMVATAKVAVRHVGKAAELDNVLNAVNAVASQFGDIDARVAAYQGRILSNYEIAEFEREALALRIGDDNATKAARVSPYVGMARRLEDAEPTLWNVFNRVQENIVRPVRGSGLRAIRSIDASATINRQLATMADRYLLAA
jgi:hypothetical protein